MVFKKSGILYIDQFNSTNIPSFCIAEKRFHKILISEGLLMNEAMAAIGQTELKGYFNLWCVKRGYNSVMSGCMETTPFCVSISLCPFERSGGCIRRGSRGGEMGEFSPPPPPFLSPSSIMLMHRPQTPQLGFGSLTLLQKFTLHFKILNPRLCILLVCSGIRQYEEG